MEIGHFGGIHYQGTQLHLEIVVAISNCHLLHCGSGIVRGVCRVGVIKWSPSVRAVSCTYIHEISVIPYERMSSVVFFITKAHGRRSESLRITATLASCQPDEDILRGKVMKLPSSCCFHFKAAPHCTEMRSVSQVCPNIAFKVPASRSNDPTSSVSRSRGSCELYLPVVGCRAARAELSQPELYCNQLFSSGIQAPAPDRGIPAAHHRPNQTLKVRGFPASKVWRQGCSGWGRNVSSPAGAGGRHVSAARTDVFH